MKKKLFILFIIIIGIFFIFPKKNNFNTSTVLIIVEESENGEIVVNEAPISDGIFDALWEDDQIIFFDMKIQNHLNFNNKDLDINPFINDAKGAGADSILLIKIDYSFKQINENYYNLNIKEYYFNFYSLIEQKSLIAGKKELVFNKRVREKEKNIILKKFGVRIIDEIYN